MEISILISKILSVGYLSFGLGVLLNQDYYKRELTKILDNSAILLYGGFMAIVFGFIIIEFHNTWHNDWTTIITIIGWIALIKGIILLAFPNLTQLYQKTIFHPDNLVKILVPLLFIMGILFGYFGFFN